MIDKTCKDAILSQRERKTFFDFRRGTYDNLNLLEAK